MFLYTIGFTKKSAEQFFEKIKYYRVKLLVDIRLSNDSQLSGFTRKRDMPYFLEKLCNCEYVHCPEYAPTKGILSDYKKKKITWPEYEILYTTLMNERNSVDDFITRFDSLYEVICLLCSEDKPKFCHRRLFADMIQKKLPEIELKHI